MLLKLLKRFRDDRSGMTLIEITIVIVILGLLASFIAPRVLTAPEKARVAKAKQEISALETALNLYAINVGDYPSTENGLEGLWTPPNPEPDGWERVLSKPTFDDPWKRRYVYVYPGTHEGYDYDLFSMGKDGKEGGGDDLTSWIEETE